MLKPAIFRSTILLLFILLLTGCSQRSGTPAADSTEPASPAASVSDNPVSPDKGSALPAAAADELAGSYYNDYLGMTLRLDGEGGCTLSGSGTDAAGTYTVDGDTLTLDFGTVQETASVDERGDISIEGRAGWFLADWALWNISESEAGAPLSAPVGDREILTNADGTLRCRDFTRQLAVTYPADYTLLPDRLPDALTVTDGTGTYVIGRNVTTELSASAGEAEVFLSDYVETRVFSDFDTLFGTGRSAFEQQVYSDSTDGRLAAGTLRLENPAHNIAVTVILYTSAYADGTENFICKCFFVPAEDTARQEVLSAAVTDMGAVRKS